MHHWYDKQREPWRFLIFMVPMGILIVAAELAPIPWNGVAFGVMLLALINRARYIRRTA